MSRTIRLGRILGIMIELDYTWFIVFALVALTLSVWYFPGVFPNMPLWLSWVLGLSAAVLFFASVLIHELMHSVVAQRYGMQISSISLFVFGGVSRITGEPPTPGVELKMAAAGPFASLVLAVFFYALVVWSRALGLGQAFTALVAWLAIMNGALTVFNLVPGFPLDGGRLLRAIIWRATGNQLRATRVAAGIGQGFGYLLMGVGVLSVLLGGLLSGVWWLFIGWFLVQAAANSYQQTLLQRALAGVSVDRLMSREVTAVPATMNLAELVDDYFLTRSQTAYPVVDDGGNLAGMVTTADVRSIPRQDWVATPVSRVVQPISEDNTVTPETDGWDALLKMATGNRGRLLVTSNHHLVGMVSQSHILDVLRHRMDLGDGTPSHS